MVNATSSLRTIVLVGCGVSLAGLALFVFFAAQVLNAGPVTCFDLECAEEFKLQAESHQALLSAMRVVTHVGGVEAMTGLAIAGALVLLLRRQYVLAAGWVIAAGGGCLVNVSVKSWIDRERPPEWLRDEAVTERNESYPSGHSMGSTIGLGSLAYVLLIWLKRRDLRAFVIVCTVALVLLIGFSRMYLRAHWFSDVLGGFGLGIFWLGSCVTGMEIMRRRGLGDTNTAA